MLYYKILTPYDLIEYEGKCLNIFLYFFQSSCKGKLLSGRQPAAAEILERLHILREVAFKISTPASYVIQADPVAGKKLD